MAQRLVRAKRKIQEARIPYETPVLDRLAERLDAVRSVIYLVFNAVEPCLSCLHRRDVGCRTYPKEVLCP
jgi:predicted RNA polymerase sigma factor